MGRSANPLITQGGYAPYAARPPLNVAAMRNALLLTFGLLAMGVHATEFLPAERAFDLHVEQTRTGMVLVANVAPGYALYREKIKVSGTDVKVSRVDIPRGLAVDEPGVGRTELLTGVVRMPLQVGALKPGAARLTVNYLGCKIDKYCYPPQRASLGLGVSR